MVQAAICERIKAVATAAPLAGILLVQAMGGADGVSGTNDASQVFVASAGYRPGLDPEKLDWTVPVPLQNQARLVGMGLAISVDDYGGAAVGRGEYPRRSPCLG